VLAPHSRWRAAVVPAVSTDDVVGPVAPAPRVPATVLARRLDWAALLQRVFAVDVMRCSCGGRRRVLAFLVESHVTRAILAHLGLPAPIAPAPARAPPQPELPGWHDEDFLDAPAPHDL
jgi:hypothetical protein